MKKTLSSFVFLLLITLLVACSNPAQEEILTYVNEELPAIADTEAEIIGRYDSVTGENYIDDPTLYEALTVEIIPDYGLFIADLEAIEVTDEKLREIHEDFIAAANKQHKAFTRIVTAIENQDYAVIEEANALLAEARKEMRDFQHDLKTYAEENDVEISEE